MDNRYSVSVKVTKYRRYLRHDTIEFIAPDRTTAKVRAREMALDPHSYSMDCTATADLRTVTKLK